MERTPTTQGTPGHRHRRLLAYCVGFIVLTNVLTIVFVFLLRSAADAPAPVILERVQPAAEDAPEPAAHARVEDRQVRVTSRPAGAVVTYQGQTRGTTPLSIALPAHAAGALELAKQGYGARAVTVEPGQAEVHVRLVRDRRAGRSARRDAARGGQAGQAGDKPGDKPGDQAGAGQSPGPAAQEPTRAGQPGDTRGDPAGSSRSAGPAAPEQTRADQRGDQPGAGQGSGPASPGPAAPGPARSSARRSPAQGDPLSQEDSARSGANPDS